MSYCRFSDGDVYAYECEGGVQFWVSGSPDRPLGDHLCNTFNEAYQYAKELRDVLGLDVPSYAIEALRNDAMEEARRITGPNSAVADVQLENAKLRELSEKLVILAFARCADCDLLDASCALVSTQKCLLWNECESIARELGIEVDG